MQSQNNSPVINSLGIELVKCSWDNVYRHPIVPEIREAALKLCHAPDWETEGSLKAAMDEIESHAHWKNPTSTLVGNKDKAVLYAAALIFYHAGVEIAANEDGTLFGISSKGYNFYTGEN